MIRPLQKRLARKIVDELLEAGPASLAKLDPEARPI